MNTNKTEDNQITIAVLLDSQIKGPSWPRKSVSAPNPSPVYIIVTSPAPTPSSPTSQMDMTSFTDKSDLSPVLRIADPL